MEQTNQLQEQLSQAQNYIINLKLQIGDLYSGCKDRDMVIERQKEEIERLRSIVEKNDTQTP